MATSEVMKWRLASAALLKSAPVKMSMMKMFAGINASKHAATNNLSVVPGSAPWPKSKEMTSPRDLPIDLCSRCID